MKCLNGVRLIIFLQAAVLKNVVESETSSSINLIQRIKGRVITNSSSISKWNEQQISWTPDKAIDNVIVGDPNTCNCCSGTQNDQTPWWEINLGNIYTIEYIKVYGRTDGSSPRQYQDLWIFVGNNSLQSTNGSLVYHGNPNNGSFAYLLHLSTSNTFQYLIIKKFDMEYLTICEVQLFEKATNVLLDVKGKAETSQSSVFLTSSSFISSNAIDGNDSRDLDHCACCSVTNNPAPSWWQIDLKKKYLIGAVEVFGRGSGPTDQLEDAIILAGNSSINGLLSSGIKIATIPTLSATDQHVLFNMDSAIILQFVSIFLNRPILSICEIHLFTTVCPGTFGNGCSQICQCRNDDSCDPVTGNCRPGQCDPRVNLNDCFQYDNVILRLNATALQSSTYLKCTEDHAIDGKETPTDYTDDVYLCEACSVAQIQTPDTVAWWQLDLGKLVLVGYLRIVGRKNIPQQSQQLTVKISKDKFIRSTDVIPLDLGSQNTYIFEKELSLPRLFQYLKIEKNDTMTICEVQLLEAECNVTGWYGDSCSEPCYCADFQQCDKVTGFCKSKGCKPGWRGNSCNIPCDDGTFGPDCSSSCSLHCYNGTSQCDKETGICRLGCAEGYLGSNCTTQCTNGTYGRNCNESCGNCIFGEPCDFQTGYCPNGCLPGYTGDTCKTECTDGTFGDNCREFCFCKNDQACNKTNGQCPSGCDIMWTGDSCSKSEGIDFLTLKNVITTQTGISNEASKAIDGAKNYSIDVCNCCSVALSTDRQTAWWQIDLGQKYLIDAVSLFGRSDGTNQFQIDGAAVYAGNQSLSANSSSGSLVYTVPFNSGFKFHFGLLLKTSIVAKFFIVRIQNTTLTLCEFYLRKTNCSTGYFGSGCSHRCNCKGNAECDPATGRCKECEPGWKGEACDTNNCSKRCYCLEDSCHHISGTCVKRSGCKNGYTGKSCEIPTDEDSPNTAAIAGGTSAIVIVVAIAVLVGFFMYRRHKSKSTNQDSANKFSHLDEALRQKQQRREESSQSSRRVAGNVNAAYLETNAEDKTDTKRETGAEDNGGDYYDFGGVVGIKIHELWDYIHEKTKNDCEQLYREFKTLPSGLIHPCASADHIANRGKNRYREMYAYDHNRVVLEEKNDKGTDYVNANYIDGYKETRRFVACQGPTKQMIEDFWRMVWQLKSDKIVMLTNLIEMGATKCVLYWSKEEEFTYGKINVKIIKLETDLDFDIRHLDVWKDGESPRRIRQYHFKSWPDKDVPDSTWCLVKFWRAVRTDAESKAGPIVVHCSAGVGRTGTFIALDNLIYQARDEGCVRPFQIVQALRGQRVNMVQTKEQYVYLHEVLADALSFGTHFVWSTQFESMYTSLLQREDGEAKTRLEVQYDLIQKSLKNTESKEAAEAPEYSNIEMISLESDAYRPKLKKRGSKFVQQLGATFIPNYEGRNTFLVAMSPDKSTIEEFWSLVDDLNIKTVIMLTEKSSSCYKTSCDLGAQNDNGSKFHVKQLEEKIKKSYTERSYTFKESHREEDDHLVTVKQFEYTAWKDGYVVPGDARSLMDFLEEILKWQPHISESQPVLIYDSDGFSRSGILCVTLNEMQRINKEGGHINIVQSVKMMKQRKPKLIHSFEQYKFCYEVILAHLKHTEVYQNLK